jgi:secondary thiamine-phosphate synthase enzyme
LQAELVLKSRKMIIQKELTLKSYSRGFHLITSEILNALGELPDQGLLHVFIKHTSAALTINENADPSVRDDFEPSFNKLAPENAPYYTHTMEGPDDMPAHIKSTLAGSSVTIPVTNGSLNTGTWQGIYLCEFRNHPSRRKLVLTLYH